MRRRSPLIHQIECRIFRFDHEVKVSTQTLREKWITKLDKLFDLANSYAVNDEQEDSKLKPIAPKEQQLWAHVAAHVGLVMGNLSKGYDETRFNEDLAELERQIGEIKKLQAQIDQQRDPRTEQESAEKSDESARAHTEYASVIGYIKSLQDRWSTIHATYADVTGVGNYIVEDMMRSGIRDVNGMMFTVQSKEEMATILREKMRNNEVRIPYTPSKYLADIDLTAELNVEKYQLMKTGHLQFVHPDNKRTHRKTESPNIVCTKGSTWRCSTCFQSRRSLIQ